MVVEADTAAAFGSKLEGASDAVIVGTVMFGDEVSVFTTVSPGAGVDFVIALQPGFAKIRIKANTWMPTTMPNTFRIFIGVSVGGLVGFKLSQIRRGPE